MLGACFEEARGGLRNAWKCSGRLAGVVRCEVCGVRCEVPGVRYIALMPEGIASLGETASIDSIWRVVIQLRLFLTIVTFFVEKSKTTKTRPSSTSCVHWASQGLSMPNWDSHACVRTYTHTHMHTHGF